MRTIRARIIIGLLFSAALGVVGANAAAACGGFFCSNDPVDQVAERIVFTVNGDDTITSLIEISYQGEAADFSWVLPIPEPIAADDVAVPDGGPEVFAELHSLTDVRITGPDSECPVENDVDFSLSAEDSGVEVFASGEVGPFGFDVIGSEDPNALVDWLRENGYVVDRTMEPIIGLYVDEAFSFIAMRLLDGETSESIVPVELTYPGTQPMIPLRLTAIAAFDNMPIFTWIFADTQTVPENYGHMEISTDELRFGRSGNGSNYTSLIQSRADAFDRGQAFITEFAGPASQFNFIEPYLRDRSDRYLTRLTTYISPSEMSIDPVFTFDAERDDVSNRRDASNRQGLRSCDRDGLLSAVLPGDAIDPTGGTDAVLAATPGRPLMGQPFVPFVLLAAVLMAAAAGVVALRRAISR